MPEQEKKNAYSATLNLPQTEFSMRGDLPQKEPAILAKWDEMDIYHKVQEKNTGRPKFILHDGPPYANGNIHLGHALNKCLKDFIVKSRAMMGYHSPYVPGWDTHGLPIEQKAIKALGINRNKVSKAEFRDRCKAFALSYVDTQKKEFRRLGVTADWENPYITLFPDFEAVQIGAFGEMAKKGYAYKGMKPVYWCPSCETALAEAEIEYEEIRSASIYVKFKVKDGKGILPEDASVVIWTTTPWTIPANLAICLNPDYVYALLAIKGEKWLIAKEMIDFFLKETGLTNEPYEILAEYNGQDLEYIACQHPLFERESTLILGEHVTLEAGTGCVHTAPGHGADDFIVGRKYNLDAFCPVDGSGHFTEEAGPYAGLSTDEGNKAVCRDLEAGGALVHFGMVKHQYPMCWRCHTPILFRATEQWFASIDGFREKALQAIDSVKFIPSWGHDRIYNMIHDRGDWCISRQRTWGVPIPIFYCEECNEPCIDDFTIQHLQAIFRKEGSQAWWTHDVEYLMPAGYHCPKCGGTHFRPETDTMDVWFDSGSSHLAVLENKERWPELRWPADLYLEGSDQHRGWFNSSLCISVANRGVPPYRAVLTHGFLVDEEGKKQSKSLGNTINPQDIIDQLGADIVRLWVSSVDYRSDISNSMNIFKQIGDAYRKLRNTLRYLLGNLYDFDIEKDLVPFADMAELDRWAMVRLNRLTKTVWQAYEEYEFHVVFHSIHSFCVLDMSAFYLDIIKDTLYTEKVDSFARKSAQSALYHIADHLMRLLTPILAFTTEEFYSHMPKVADSPISVQLLDMPQYDPTEDDEALLEKWDKFLACREAVLAALEKARQDKTIGHPLDAAVTITPDNALAPILASLKEDLARLFIVSSVELKAAAEETTISVRPATGEKCDRCWVRSESVGTDAEHPHLCARCTAVLR